MEWVQGEQRCGSKRPCLARVGCGVLSCHWCCISGRIQLLLPVYYQIVLAGIRHLKGLGHTRIAFFKGPKHNGDTETRWAALVRAAAEIGVTVTDELTATTGSYFDTKLSMMERGYNAAMSLLQRTRDFTALLAFNDGSAIGAIRAIQDVGLTIPGDISVMGVDDIQLAEFISPRLTTIRQPLKEMGAIAASTLLRRIHGEDVPQETVLQPELVIRESTAAHFAKSKTVSAALD